MLLLHYGIYSLPQSIICDLSISTATFESRLKTVLYRIIVEPAVNFLVITPHLRFLIHAVNDFNVRYQPCNNNNNNIKLHVIVIYKEIVEQ
jgi:hypothetical protein